MNQLQLIHWLLQGDISIQYQTHRDLLHSQTETLTHLRNQIHTQGFAQRFLSLQNPNGHWGRDFYQPKWISTHYTLLDLRNLEVLPLPQITRILNILLSDYKNPLGSITSDECINGMFLNYAAHFQAPQTDLESIIDFLLDQLMPDGGFNCEKDRSHPIHSSLHTTLSVLEGIQSLNQNHYTYRKEELAQAQATSIEFILMHRLYKSDHTGEIIKKSFTMLSYPPRWFYDILRALDYFQLAQIPYDSRMQDALDLLKSKQRKDGTWPVQAKHTGQVHFDMEPTGKPSRFNTLRALRVLNFYQQI